MATPEKMAAAMKDHSLADVIHDIGYTFTASLEECKNNMLNFGAREPTAVDVAKTISMMIKYRPGSQDGFPIQTPGNFWPTHGKDAMPQGAGKWNTDVFIQALKELVPTLNWKEVILQLDHQDFVVPDREALNLLFSILRLGLEIAGYPANMFPVEYLCRRWTNLEGQISLISNILKHPDIFSFADHPFHRVSIDLLKPSQETDKTVGTWRSLYLVELLLYASEHGYYVQVIELFKIPMQHCPDVLLLVLLQIEPPLTPVRQELLSTLIPIFLINHPNSGMILHRTWNAQNLNLKSIIMHAMADWYLRGECDQSRLSRILDVAHDLKALSLLLKMQSFPFTIDLACLASRRKYLKLDKWLMDQIREFKETFVAALVKFLQMRYSIILSSRRYEEQPPKIAQLSQENIATVIECLYVCIPNTQKELQEAIYKVVSDYQALMPRETQPTRVLQNPYNSTGTVAGDPISALMPNFANISLNAPGNAMFSISDHHGPLSTAPGSPSRPIGAGTNSPFSTMPIHHNQNMADIAMPTGMTPIPMPEKPLIQNPRVPYPEAVQNVSKDVEDEANRYFQRIYSHSAHPALSINEILDMLQKFQDSPNKKEREIFSYMLQNLFEEYKFFPQYPDKELHITAQLFGGIIEKGLVPSYVSLGLALRFVLEALKKGEGTKMFYFGITALDRFKSRLKEYQRYCEHVKAIPYFNKFPAHLIEYVEYGLQSQEPPTKAHGPGQPVTINQMANQSPAVTTVATFGDFVPRSVAGTPSISEMTTAGSVAGRPSIATVSNIDTLLSATDDSEKITVPPEPIQDKTAFIFNNLSQLNLQVKCEELKKIVTEEYFPWLSQYLVVKRVSIEFNFHMLYSNFLDVFKVQEVNQLVTRETYRNIKVILRCDKERENFTDRSLLKNLGHWLGLLTLARNLPILHKDIDVKALLLEAYHRSREELLYIVPFVAKILESCARSVVFKPPNPWTMALMNVLAELHQEPNLELNLKFEVEVLCKNLSLDINDLKPVIYLRDPEMVNTIKFQLSSQPIKQRKEVEAAAVMPLNQSTPQQMQIAPQPKQMMRAILTPADLVPSDPTLAFSHPEPRFNYLEVNLSSSNFDQHISFNPHILLFQNYPHLKQFVKPAIERSIQEWIHAVVDRAIKYAMTTCEQIIRKDFALDPDELRMRTCAHHLMRNLTAGIAMVTCREQIVATISTNLKAAFSAALLPVTAPQDVVDNAASVIANDNMELACTFIQKTAVEKALPELDKRLMQDYEIRKQAREGGCRYYDPHVLTYQSEMIPEPCRLQVGGPNETQLSVYEEFAWNIPGFAPVRDAALLTPKPTQEIPMPQQSTPNYNQVLNQAQVSSDELSALAASAELFLASCLGNASKAALAKHMHSLLECLSFAQRHRDLSSGYALLQKAVEGILDMPLPATDLDTTRYRDIHLRVLKLLESPRMYGHVWTTKQVTGCLTDCREEVRYNIEAVDCLIRNNLVHLPQYDITLARMMDNGKNRSAVAFAMQLVQLYLAEDRSQIVPESDLPQTSQVLAKVVTHSPRAPAGLLDVVRVNQDPIVADKSSILGPTAQIHSGIMQVRSNNYDDPPGLKQKTEIFFDEWRKLLRSPLTEVGLQQNFTLYLQHMNMNVILDSEALTTKFLTISAEMCIENVYHALSEDKMNNQTQSPTTREKYYSTCDSFTKLVTLLIKNTPERNVVQKLNLLNKTLGIIAGFLLRDHEDRGTEFQQLPYHRLMMMLLLDMTVAEPVMESISYQVLTAFCYTLHTVRPALAAGFAYAWLELGAHRVFIERVLAITPQQKGWGMYSTLLIDLFKFLDPFLRNTELAAPVMELYKGTLKLLLVLLHDFPEFLCDYHYSFCDVIPSNCIQMRNLILSAFPRNMRLPDPFTPNLKVDLLSEIAIPPRAVVNYATVLPDSQFKKDLDIYLRERTPVTFLSELRSNMQVVNEPGSQYNSQLINAVVLYVGTQAIASICAKGSVPSMATIAHSAHMDIFQNFAVGFDYEGRYIFLNAVANQLRYPNSHTHYFSCVLLHLFAEANTDAIQIQITRMLLERLIANRPHPWGLLVTFVELIKNPVYKFLEREFVHSIPDIENFDKFPPLYNYIVEKVIGKISGRKDITCDAENIV